MILGLSKKTLALVLVAIVAGIKWGQSNPTKKLPVIG